jgi:hypothetical protein
MSYRLFLDDVRKVDTIYPNNPFSDWVIIKNYGEFVKIITERGLPIFVSFDHDLADEHYDFEAMKSQEVYDKVRTTFKEKTGLECAKWLVDYCGEQDKDFPDYHVHSFNPVGAENIRGYIECFKKFRFEQS